MRSSVKLGLREGRWSSVAGSGRIAGIASCIVASIASCVAIAGVASCVVTSVASCVIAGIASCVIGYTGGLRQGRVASSGGAISETASGGPVEGALAAGPRGAAGEAGYARSVVIYVRVVTTRVVGWVW